MESEKTNEGELTSTMGNLLSTSKDEKNDASDSTPTSSTDAFTATSTSQIAADDPISSTSSDVLDPRKSTDKVDVAQSSTNNVLNTNPVMNSLKDMIGDHSSPIVSEKDLLDMNITDTSTEKCTENVDDIVQDLENLLGEPTTSFHFTIRPRGRRNYSTVTENKDISMDFDAFSAELQMLEEKSTSSTKTTKETPGNGIPTVQIPNDLVTPATDVIKESPAESVSTNETVEPTPICIQEATESTQPESQTSITIQGDVTQQDEKCQSEDVSASIEPTTVDKTEAQAITSTEFKEPDVPSPEEDKEKTSQKATTDETKQVEELGSSEEKTATLPEEIQMSSEDPTESENDNLPKTVSCEDVEMMPLAEEPQNLPKAVDESLPAQEQNISSHRDDSEDLTKVEKVVPVEEKRDQEEEEIESQKEDAGDSNEDLPVKIVPSIEENQDQRVDDVNSQLDESEAAPDQKEDKAKASEETRPEDMAQDDKEIESNEELPQTAGSEDVEMSVPVEENQNVEKEVLGNKDENEDLQESVEMLPSEELQDQKETVRCQEQEEQEEKTDQVVSSPVEAIQPSIEAESEIAIEKVPIIEAVEIQSASEPTIEEVQDIQGAKTEEAEVENTEETKIEKPAVQNVEKAKIEEPEVQNNEEAKIEEPEVQNMEEAKIEEPEVQNMEGESEVQNVGEDKIEDTEVQKTEETKIEEPEVRNMEVVEIEEPEVQNMEGASEVQNVGEVKIEEPEVQKTEEAKIEEPEVQNIEGASEVQKVSEAKIEEPEVQKAEEAIIEEPEVKNMEVGKIEEPEVQNVEGESEVQNVSEAKIEQPEVQNMEVARIEEPKVQNVDEVKIEEPEVEKAEETRIEELEVQNMEEAKIEEPEVQSIQETKNQEEAEVQSVPKALEVPNIGGVRMEEAEVESTESKTEASSNSEQQVVSVDPVVNHEQLPSEVEPAAKLEDYIVVNTEQPLKEQLSPKTKEDEDVSVETGGGEAEAPVEESKVSETREEKMEIPTIIEVEQKVEIVLVERDQTTKETAECDQIIPQESKIEEMAKVMSEQQENIESISPNDKTAETSKQDDEVKIADEKIDIDVSPIDFTPIDIALPSRSLAEDLDLLVQDTINDESMTTPPDQGFINFEEAPNEVDLETPTTQIDNLKSLEDQVIENSILPLAIDVPDLDVLNVLNDKENVTEGDTLLSSSSLERSFEPAIDTALPTVDEIFAEPNQQDLQDDNLETLLAVASLQNDDYNMAAVDFAPSVDFVPEEAAVSCVEIVPEPAETAPIPEIATPSIEEFSSFSPKLQDAKIESLFEEKQAQKINDEKGLIEPLVINIDDSDKERVYSPKITIKPIKPSEDEDAVTSASEIEANKGSLKMTITKQSDNTHSILKLYDPNDDAQNQEHIPKLIIKPIVQPSDQPQSPKISTRSSKVFSPTSTTNQRSSSPRITIKPIPKPEESVAPLKITIKPVLKPDESHRQKHSPKLTIKPIVKPEEENSPEPKVHSPRVTIKPIVKPPEELEQSSSPRITIKPIVKPVEPVPEHSPTTPRVTIKPVVKPEEIVEHSPKITIKPIIKPQEIETLEDFEESIKERIVLKINKGTIPGSSKGKREIPVEEEKSEKLAKIKLKFSKEGGHPHIVQLPTKRPSEQIDHTNKRQKIDESVTITPIPPATHSKLKEMLSRSPFTSNKTVTTDDDDDDVTIVEETNKPSPIVISEESNQDSMNSAAVDLRDPISEIPVFEITPDSVKTLNPQPPPVEVVTLPAPRKRGRPRKVPLQVREDFKDPKEEEPKPVVIESTRPKRSCRGQSVRTTLGIKPRKPRGPGRGRGSKRGMGTRSTTTPPEPPPKAAKEPKLSGAKLKELKEESFLLSDKTEIKIEIDDGLQKSPSNSLLAPPQSDTSTTDRADIVMYEEETRMSAETSSRAQTPAKQVVTSIAAVDLVEESQSSLQSIQSTATTESVKVRRGPRLEVHQEPEGAVISADQLAEYYWSGGGPFMLQEQVAQFLGIKSFKRKYPNIARRVVDMQERDFIRESGLAGEAMCDLGLTAVNSSDILDIMYSDFQDKYEEYCKHQRDRQAKDLTNKQRALSLAASQEKTKMDITQQAVQSAASWNATFNKARRDQRKACMDLQTLTVHFPKGKMKQIGKPKIGYYPVALVPGQYTDYYREFTPTEINNLPLSTLCYDRIVRASNEMDCDSQTDGSGSESDTSSSDSDSSFSGSSDAEDCTICKPTPKRIAAAQ